MSELSPVQLDAIEDALEGLGPVGTSVPGRSGPVARRLQDYAEILTLSREALPMVDVPTGLLDGVMAEARASGAVQTAASAQSAGSKPWWKRISLFVPVLAVAGSAALVLLFVGPQPVRPQDAAEPPALDKLATAPQAAAPAKTDPEPTAISDQVGADRTGLLGRAQSDGQLADRSVDEGRGRLRFGERDAARGAGAADDAEESSVLAEKAATAAGEEPEPAPAPKPQADPADADAPIVYEDRKRKENNDNRAPRSAKKPNAATKKSEGAPPPAPAPPPTADAPGAAGGKGSSASGSMDTIVAGDVLRRRGKCSVAVKKYAKVRKASSAAVRARALAGLGLCQLAGGHTDAAEALFRQARSADARVANFIASERAPESGKPQADQSANDDPLLDSL